MSELRGLRGCTSLGPLFTGTVRCLGAASLGTRRLKGMGLRNSSLMMGFSRAGPGAGRRTGLRARGRFVSVRVPLSKIRIVNCATHRSLPRTSCSTSGSVSFCPKLTRDCVPMGPKVFTVFFPRSTRTPKISPSNIGGIVIGILI